jgi:uncharacterized membrane protein
MMGNSSTMKARLLKTAALLIAFSLLVAVATFLDLQGITSYLTVIFLGYCAIIVLSHLWAALLLVWQAWRKTRDQPKALLLWQTRRESRGKSQSTHLTGD